MPVAYDPTGGLDLPKLPKPPWADLPPGAGVGAGAQIPGVPISPGAGAQIVDKYGGDTSLPPAPSTPLPPPDTLPPGPGGGAPVPPVGAPNTPTPPGYPGFYDPGTVASSAAQSAWAREQARNAIIAFGDPTLASLAGFGFDPQDAAFAQQNYLSGGATLARLNKQHDLSRRSIINRLAGHGILNSGDLGYLEGQEGQSYGNQVYDARLQLLNYLTQLFGGSAQQSNALRQKLLINQVNNFPTVS